MRLALVLVVVAGCAAPPMGLGMGPRLPSPSHGVVGGAVGMSAGAGRQTFQAQAQARYRVARPFAMELGAAYTQLAERADDGREIHLIGVLPYLRPTLAIGPVTAAVALSGLGFGGGGGGLIGGLIDGQLGYARGRWAAYVGAYRHGYELVAEQGIDTSSRQFRAGGAYAARMGRSEVGVALEVYDHRDTLGRGGTTIASHFIGAGVTLTVASPEFR